MDVYQGGKLCAWMREGKKERLLHWLFFEKVLQSYWLVEPKADLNLQWQWQAISFNCEHAGNEANYFFLVLRSVTTINKMITKLSTIIFVSDIV